MAAGITDTLSRVTDSTTGRPVIAQLANPGKAIGAISININDATNWTTQSAIHFSIFNTITVAGITIKDTSTQTDWKGVLAGTTITNLTLTGGADRAYTAGALVELTPTARYAKDLYDNIRSHANQDGSLIPAAVQAALNLGSSSLNGWTPLAYTPNTITYRGNRIYDLVFNGVDITGTVSNGMRLRTTRATVAPTQSASLNGTNQYFSKATPVGMTFTDDFVVSAWVKMSAYPSSEQVIVSRYDGTNGWSLQIQSGGQVLLYGRNGGVTNQSYIVSSQAVPLNRWVHITAQLDMSSFTASPTTSYVMIDGIDVPCSVARGGTNPVALVQAGNLQIGASNSASFFPGKIAQVAIYSSKVTQATILTTISQGLTGAEVSLVSAYSFSNSINDLNATNANNLTPNGSAAATSADSPFGGQADGTISATLDYAEIISTAFSTNTTISVRLPDGNAIPTIGGVTNVAYSSNQTPYGWPGITNVLGQALLLSSFSTSSTTATQVLGLTVSVVVPTWARRIKITAFVRDIYSATSAGYMPLSIWDGAVGSGTQLTSAQTNPTNTTGQVSLNPSIVISVTPGNKTYNVGLSTTAGTANIEASPTGPAYLMVEID